MHVGGRVAKRLLNANQNYQNYTQEHCGRVKLHSMLSLLGSVVRHDQIMIMVIVMATIIVMVMVIAIVRSRELK